MPLYEYECEACGHRFEVIQKFSDAPIEKCPKCGSPVHKLQSAPAFHLKGTGWYATDYAKSGSSSEAKGSKDKDGKKTESSGSSDSSSSSEKPASTDSTSAASTTPAAKPETK